MGLAIQVYDLVLEAQTIQQHGTGDKATKLAKYGCTLTASGVLSALQSSWFSDDLVYAFFKVCCQVYSIKVSYNQI